MRQLAKTQRSQRRRGSMGPPSYSFVKEVTADTIASAASESRDLLGEEYAVFIYDRGAKWLGCYPTAAKSARDAVQVLQHFLGSESCGRLYAGN